MATYSKAGYFGWAGGGKDGAIVDIWLQSRFSNIPAFNSAPPAGAPDGGPVITGVAYGGHGAFNVTVSTLADYYLRIQYGGEAYWTEVPANVLQGGPVGGGGGGGGISVVTGDETSINVANGNTIPLISLMPGTGDVTWAAGSTATTLGGTSNVNAVVAALPSVSALAPLDSPHLTGDPRAPNPSTSMGAEPIATTDWVESQLLGPVPITSAATTNYLLSTDDSETRIEFSAGTAVTVTVDSQANEPFPTGTGIELVQMGIGQLVVGGATGVTVVSPNGLKSRAQYSSIYVTQSHTIDTWVVSGDSTT